MNHLSPPRRRTLRALLAAAIALVGLVALAGPAAAHTEAEATAAAAGRTSITFSFGHGCNDQPTTTFRAQIPDGASDITPQNPDGWTSTIEPGQIRWTGGSITGAGSFTVEMVLAQPVGDTVVMPVIQGCPDNLEEAWIQLPDGNGTEPAMPAPEFVVPANDTSVPTPSTTASTVVAASGDADSSARMAIEQTPITVEGSSTNTSGLIIFILVVGAIAGGALVLFLRYRGRGSNSAPRS